jgi:hypothetical protein
MSCVGFVFSSRDVHVFVLGAPPSRRLFVEKTEKRSMAHILLGNCDCQQPAGGTPAFPGRHESKKYAASGETPALPGQSCRRKP